MSPIIVLTGPAAAGKNTIANLYAKKQKKGTDIDADLVRWMYRQPHVAPWENNEGIRQLELGSKHVALLSRAFHEEGCNVIISDVITDTSAKIYKDLLLDIGVVIVRLLPSWKESIRRLHERRHTITDEEAKWVYDLQENLTKFDLSFDNTNIPAEEIVDKLLII